MQVTCQVLHGPAFAATGRVSAFSNNFIPKTGIVPKHLAAPHDFLRFALDDSYLQKIKTFMK